MKFTAFALAAAVTSVSSANFVSYVVTKTSTTNSGVALDVYTLWARFDGPTDTILNAFNFNRVDGSAGNMFYHKDNASYNSGVLQQEFGTWSPGQTGNATANRPFDSYLTIGNQAVGTNPTQADPSLPSAGGSWGSRRSSERLQHRLVQPEPAEFPGSCWRWCEHRDRRPPRTVRG